MFYSRAAYVGQKTKDDKRMHGRGIFTLANGNKYVGTFHDGAFHGEGIIFFTPANGGGQYRGRWEHGKNTAGEYIFSDGLQYEEEGWGHCTPQDRKFWDEYLAFIRPATLPDSEGDGTKIPDYSTTDGIPPAFSNGKPQGMKDVTDNFWMSADPPRPEHEGAEPVPTEGRPGELMAQEIARACPRS